MKLDTITGPDWAASYLVNGDASGISDEDRAMVDAWLEQNGNPRVVDVARDENGEAIEARFTWRYWVHFPQTDCDDGNVLDYVVHIQD